MINKTKTKYTNSKLRCFLQPPILQHRSIMVFFYPFSLVYIAFSYICFLFLFFSCVHISIIFHSENALTFSFAFQQNIPNISNLSEKNRYLRNYKCVYQHLRFFNCVNNVIVSFFGFQLTCKILCSCCWCRLCAF